jgi:hypothetical protein
MKVSEALEELCKQASDYVSGEGRKIALVEP